MNFIAIAVSVVSGITSLFGLLYLSAQTGVLVSASQGAYAGGLGFTGMLLGIVLVTFLVAGLAWVAAMAVTIRLLKGPNHLSWVTPAACSRLAYWVSCEWDFYGKYGRDKGIRVLGLELSLARPNMPK